MRPRWIAHWIGQAFIELHIEQRLAKGRAAEITEALGQIHRIARLRLDDRIAG